MGVSSFHLAMQLHPVVGLFLYTIAFMAFGAYSALIYFTKSVVFELINFSQLFVINQ